MNPVLVRLSCCVWPGRVIVHQEVGALARQRGSEGVRHLQADLWVSSLLVFDEPSEHLPFPGRDRVGHVVVTPRLSLLASSPAGAAPVQCVPYRGESARIHY